MKSIKVFTLLSIVILTCHCIIPGSYGQLLFAEVGKPLNSESVNPQYNESTLQTLLLRKKGNLKNFPLLNKKNNKCHELKINRHFKKHEKNCNQAFSHHNSHPTPCCPHRCPLPECHLGSSQFRSFGPSEWYQVLLPSIGVMPDAMMLPISINSTPISLHSNSGFTQGNEVKTDSGLRLNEPGNYSVSFSIILSNLNTPDTSTLIVPVFLEVSGMVNPLTTLGTVVVIPDSFIATGNFTGILPNVTAGATLRLVASNGGDGSREVSVVGWTINAFKIPCGDSLPTHCN